MVVGGQGGCEPRIEVIVKIKKKSRQILFDYTLHQQKLEHVQSAKYLGLTITDNLDWGQHVSEISCKATKTQFSPGT